ncbi:hypothetical protein HanIR_Chr05g0218491 [Helianthus annuus]|nr:hypothetical protein HanIR_Chr05g0218491 [Helianthus annuus]
MSNGHGAVVNSQICRILDCTTSTSKYNGHGVVPLTHGAVLVQDLTLQLMKKRENDQQGVMSGGHGAVLML